MYLGILSIDNLTAHIISAKGLTGEVITKKDLSTYCTETITYISKICVVFGSPNLRKIWDGIAQLGLGGEDKQIRCRFEGDVGMTQAEPLPYNIIFSKTLAVQVTFCAKYK